MNERMKNGNEVTRICKLLLLSGVHEHVSVKTGDVCSIEGIKYRYF